MKWAAARHILRGMPARYACCHSISAGHTFFATSSSNPPPSSPTIAAKSSDDVMRVSSADIKSIGSQTETAGQGATRGGKRSTNVCDTGSLQTKKLLAALLPALG